MKYIIKDRSKHLICWGRYNMYQYNKRYFITKKSYACRNTTGNSTKELIVTNVPGFLIMEILNKKHLDNRYIKKIKNLIKFYKKDGEVDIHKQS